MVSPRGSGCATCGERSQTMRLLFFGTPGFAVPTLKSLLTLPEFQVAAVITQPDRPRGRTREVSAPLVKQTAAAAGIPVHQPEKIGSGEARELLLKLKPEAIVIIAYGQIIPAQLLGIPKYGWINLHASLLPKYRGAAPINWAIVHGETKTGLTTMRIDAGMDTGDILLQREIEIGPSETAPELAARMADAGAALMVETLRGLAAGTLISRPQDHSAATRAPSLKKEDGRIDWNRSATEIYNCIRGFAPWPGAYTTFRGQICHIWGGPLPETTSARPATISCIGTQVLVACGKGTLLRLDGVTLAGRKRITATEFANGARLAPGDAFDAPAGHSGSHLRAP